MQILLLATWPFRRLALFITSVIRHSLQWFDSDEKLEADSGKFWVAARGRSLATNAHWRGHGPFRNDATWHETGAMHKRLFIRAADWIGVDLHDCRIVEWGCGGGLNAVQFAAEAKEYFGVDVNSESLAECARQLTELNFDGFRPILVGVEDPEAAVDEIGGECDGFICTYVFELLPTRRYCERILEIAGRLLRKGGVALIQIRYPGKHLISKSRRWNYGRNMPHMVTIGIEEFWEMARASGFDPIFVSLLPQQPELSEERYAYFALQRL